MYIMCVCKKRLLEKSLDREVLEIMGPLRV